jgi:hypothetical protein
MPNHKLPEKLRVRAISDSTPLSGAWILLTLPVILKNDFQMPFGPTDETGVLEISAAEIEREVSATKNFFLMDYTGLVHWTGEIRISVMNREAVELLMDAYQTFGRTPKLFPVDLPDQMDTYQRRLREVEGQILTAEVEQEGESAATITVEPVQAW